MKHLLCILTCCVLSISHLFAQKDYNKYSSSYNYVRGAELFFNEEYASSLEEFEKEIGQHPDNGYAYIYIGILKYNTELYGEALAAVDKAIKYIPKKDKTWSGCAYKVKGDIYERLGDYEQAIACLTKSLSIDKKNISTLEQRAQLYYELEQYDLSDIDYASIKEIDEHSYIAYIGKGRNHKARAEYEEAIKQFDELAALYPDYSSAYSFRAESKLKLHKYSDAASDIVKALEIDYNDKAYYLMQVLADSSFSHINTKLKAQAASNPNIAYWQYCLAIINEGTERYEDAIKYYTKFEKMGGGDQAWQRIAICYAGIHDYKNAIVFIDKAIEADTTDFYNKYYKAFFLEEIGDLEGAVAILTNLIEQYPDLSLLYCNRAEELFKLKKYEEAIEDYTLSMDLSEESARECLRRGTAYLLIGNKDLATKDFEKCIKLDTTTNTETMKYYALYRLGRVDEAKECLQTILDQNPDDAGTYYNAACLYSLIGDIDTSLSYLEKALSLGYKSFAHMSQDIDLDNIRESPRYKEMLSKYSSGKHDSETQINSTQEYIEQISEVPFTKQGGVTKVKCEINGLPLHFIFDTGASDVTISRVEATFMLKNNYLSSNDIIGKSKYMDANGDISVGTVINLRKVCFAGMELENVRASVVDNNNAPLLLGQTILSRLGKVEIDYENSKLVIKTRVPNENK